MPAKLQALNINVHKKHLPCPSENHPLIGVITIKIDYYSTK